MPQAAEAAYINSHASSPLRRRDQSAMTLHVWHCLDVPVDLLLSFAFQVINDQHAPAAILKLPERWASHETIEGSLYLLRILHGPRYRW